jgi:hypothetical protein
MRALGSLGLGLVTAILLVAGAACSSDDNKPSNSAAAGSSAVGGSPAGGGVAGSTAGGVPGSGGATGSQFLPAAQAICTKLLTLNCPNDQQSTCATTWAGLAELAPSGCGAQQKAFYDCLALLPPSDFLCSDNGYGTYMPGVCTTQQDELGVCTG